MKKILFAFLFVFVLTYHVTSQVFVGSGYAKVEFWGSSGLDDGSGFSFQVEKDFNLPGYTRLKVHPNINITFLYANVDVPSIASYVNIMSLSPKISYEVFSRERLKIAPFANPFASYGLQPDYAIFSATSNRFKSGIEGGLRLDFTIKKTTFRLIPISICPKITWESLSAGHGFIDGRDINT
ncbi:MAG: hypothetical protein GDA51_01495 [Ekhidna sp.]|nr:hypothetical protein [Ekhidna sp.]